MEGLDTGTYPIGALAGLASVMRSRWGERWLSAASIACSRLRPGQLPTRWARRATSSPRVLLRRLHRKTVAERVRLGEPHTGSGFSC